MADCAPSREPWLVSGPGRRGAFALILAAACLAPAGVAAGQDSLRSDGLVFRYWPGQEALARNLAERTAAAPPLPALPESALDAPVDVWLAPDEARFDSLTGYAAPEWGAGIAIPAASTIVLPAYVTDRVTPAQLPRVLRHELAHVALHRYLEPLRVPRWFSEGYSRWAAGELDPEAAWRLRLAFALGGAPPLDSLSLDWPRGAVDADLAYLLAASTVQYMVASAGERGLRLLLERWRQTRSLDAAMRSTYGVTLGQFEEDWREHVRRRYGWAAVLGHATVFWAIGALLLVWLYLRRRRRNRAKLERLRATELPDEPAYWNAAGEGEDAPR